MIEWSESVDINRSSEEVLNAVRDPHLLLQWSAWPQATGYTCAVDGDGTSPGSSIVFTSPAGEEMGRQTITQTTATTVRNRLRNRSPGGRTIEPEIDFHVEPRGPGRSHVRLDFRITPPIPALLHPLRWPQLTAARLGWLGTRARRALYFVSSANRASIDLHTELGFQLIASEIDVPGVTFTESGQLYSGDLL